MVSDNGDRVRGSLKVLMPFIQSNNDCKEFSNFVQWKQMF